MSEILDGKDYIILEDFLPESYQNFIEQQLEDMDGWKYYSSASGVEKNFDTSDTNIIDSPQFTHSIFAADRGGPASHLFDDIKVMFWFLELKYGYVISEIFRIKANMLLPLGEKNNYNPPHVDWDQDDSYLSMVYYTEDSDGDTVLFDKFYEEGYENLKEIYRNKPKKGTAILFNSNRFHCSSNPTDSEHRRIINFIFKVNKVT